MRYVFTLSIMVLLAACGGSEAPSNAEGAQGLTGAVRMDGSSTVFPISEAVAEEYLAEAPGVRVTVGVSGTGGGFKKFLNQEIDINAASRPIKESEFDKAVAAGIQFIELPVAFDGISVVVNPENTWVDQLTTDELQRIWQPDSVVTTWKDVRADWPDEKIRLYGPGTDSGTFDYFTGVINGKEQASRADFTASEDDNVLIQGISGDRYALGYFGFAYYLENQDKLRAVAIDGGQGPILPTPITINDGSYAPLSRPIYIYLNAASLDKPQVADFVRFYLESAGSLAEEVGYITLPEASYAGARARVAARTSGSSYQGEIRLPKLTASSE
ncbi:MAG: PstS family phosphate ABC transporter substrate-binding protein [Pseudomonadales bacterium]